jgi:alpha-galactosidase
MNYPSKLLVLISIILIISGCSEKTTIVWLDELKIQTFSEGIASVALIKPASADSILIGKTKQDRGLRVQTTSVISFFLDGNATYYSALVGADDKGNKSVPVKFYVVGDRKVLFESKKMFPGELPVKVSVSLKGIRRLGLLVTGDEEDHFRTSGYWANAQLVMQKDQLPKQNPNTSEKYILTPAPGKNPRINSAGVFGATPGNPFLYTIAATGERPILFSADNLPKGLILDPGTGIITGKVSKRGTSLTTLHAKNAFGEATKPLKIVIGDTIALTPPIGWNGWNS